MNISDRRRILGPSEARIPSVGVSSGKYFSGDSNNKRNDEVGKMFLKKGIVETANGSAYLEVKNTIIEVSVFGPRPIRGSFVERASLSVECKFLPHIDQHWESKYASSSSNSNPNGRSGLTHIEQRISSYVETCMLPAIILEKYPKSSIDIFITVISVDENVSLLNLTSWVTNCASLAMVDSCIEIKDIVTSGQAVLNCENNELAVDCSVQSEKDENLLVCLLSTMNMKNEEIVGIWLDGNHNILQQGDADGLIDQALEMSKKIRSNFNAFLLESIE